MLITTTAIVSLIISVLVGQVTFLSSFQASLPKVIGEKNAIDILNPPFYWRIFVNIITNFRSIFNYQFSNIIKFSMFKMSHLL